YYKERKEWMPMNHEWIYSNDTNAGRAKRDADRLGFFMELLSKPATADEHPNKIDQKFPRLHDLWRLYWVRAEVIGWAGDTAYHVSKFYLSIMPWVMF